MTTPQKLNCKTMFKLNNKEDNPKNGCVCVCVCVCVWGGGGGGGGLTHPHIVYMNRCEEKGNSANMNTKGG